MGDERRVTVIGLVGGAPAERTAWLVLLVSYAVR